METVARPRIAITVAYAARQAEPELAARKNELYAAAIRRHGGDPVLIDESSSVAARESAFAAMDGLVLAGGADIDPALYGQAVAGSHDLEPDRDALEFSALRAAEARELPVLGICRGLQAINVFDGGRLVQDLAGHAGPSYGHGAALGHDLAVVPGTRLAAILGLSAPAGRLVVNSYHHQAVRHEDLAPSLQPAAWAESPAGMLVEGLERPGERFVVGIQCHIERTESVAPAFERLWAAFVEAARSSRSHPERSSLSRTGS